MSKAFVKDDGIPEDLVFTPRGVEPGVKNYMTRKGYEQLKKEDDHGDRVGDEVRVRTPQGQDILEIDKIFYTV